MESLTALTVEMRALGIKSLAIELESSVSLTYDDPNARPTEAPERDPDKPPGACAHPGCSKMKGGALGVGLDYCQEHALESMGVRP